MHVFVELDGIKETNFHVLLIIFLFRGIFFQTEEFFWIFCYVWEFLGIFKSTFFNTASSDEPQIPLLRMLHGKSDALHISSTLG
jgi:hypothetical protein